jgi:hypothetical protein
VNEKQFTLFRQLDSLRAAQQGLGQVDVEGTGEADGVAEAHAALGRDIVKCVRAGARRRFRGRAAAITYTQEFGQKTTSGVEYHKALRAAGVDAPPPVQGADPTPPTEHTVLVTQIRRSNARVRSAWTVPGLDEDRGQTALQATLGRSYQTLAELDAEHAEAAAQTHQAYQQRQLDFSLTYEARRRIAEERERAARLPSADDEFERRRQADEAFWHTLALAREALARGDQPPSHPEFWRRVRERNIQLS